MKFTEGMKTSEFGVALLVVLSALVMGLTGAVDGDTALTSITGVGAAYGLARGLAKRQA